MSPMLAEPEIQRLLGQAEAHVEAGQFADAAGVYRRIIKEHPDDARARLGLVRALSAGGRDDEALSFLEPDADILEDGALLAELGRLYYGAARYADSVRVYGRAVDRRPQDGHTLANFGFALWQDGDRQRALQTLQQALPLVEDDLRLAANMGQIFLQLSMWNEAISCFERYLVGYPTDSERRVLHAFCLRQAGWKEEAETVLREVLTVDPDCRNAQEQLEAFLDEDRAEEEATVAADVAPSDAAIPRPSDLHLTVPAEGEGAETATAAPRLDFGDLSVVEGLSEASLRRQAAQSLIEDVSQRLEREGIDAAIAFLESERGVSETPAEVLNLLGKLLVEEGDYESAATALREAVELDPFHPQAHSNLGVLLWQMGEVEEAINVLRRAVELDTDDHDALVNLGLICHQVGLHEEAVNLYTKYLDAHPEDTKTRMELAECYVALEERSAALEELDTVLLLEPENEAAQKRFDELSTEDDGAE
jgi:tetratricopeptide (TPR) repeat protein